MRQLMNALDFMGCELQYRMTPLPELCKEAAQRSRGVVQQVFCALSRELEEQISPDAVTCMKAVIAKNKKIPPKTEEILLRFGDSLGCFDLSGQINGLDAARLACRNTLDGLEENREIRLRSYQTLGICAGAALVVIFI